MGRYHALFAGKASDGVDRFRLPVNAFPLIGILTGTTLVNSSKRLADGKKVKMYDKTTIRHGKYMLICGITFTLLWLTRRLYLTSL